MRYGVSPHRSQSFYNRAFISLSTLRGAVHNEYADMQVDGHTVILFADVSWYPANSKQGGQLVFNLSLRDDHHDTFCHREELPAVQQNKTPHCVPKRQW